jgi:hypothetical protein
MAFILSSFAAFDLCPILLTLYLFNSPVVSKKSNQKFNLSGLFKISGFQPSELYEKSPIAINQFASVLPGSEIL